MVLLLQCWNSTGNLFEGLDLDKSIDVDAINFDEFDEKFKAPKIPTDGIDTLIKKIGEIPADCDCKNGDCNVDGGHKIELVANAEAAKVQSKFAENKFNKSPLVNNIKTSASALVDSIKTAINGFKDATSCYFIACTWEETVDVICGGLIGSLGMLATMELLIAIFAFPFAVSVMVVMMRHGGHGPIRNDEAKDGGSGYELPMKNVASPQKYAVADAQVYNA